MNITQAFIPKVDEASKNVGTNARTGTAPQSPERRHHRGDGHTSANISSLHKDADGRLHRQLVQTVGFYQPFLVQTQERMREKYKPSVDDGNILSLSELLKEMSGDVSEERKSEMKVLFDGQAALREHFAIPAE